MVKIIKYIAIVLILSFAVFPRLGYAQEVPFEDPAKALDKAAGIASEHSSKIDILDLKNMDVNDVLKLISRKSNLNIVASQDVQGRVTVYLKDVGALDALRIISKANGWAYVDEGDLISVITAATYTAKYGMAFDQDIKTKMVHLEHINAAELMPVLEQIKSTSGKIISSAQSNALILMDTLPKLDEMTNIISSIDVERRREVYDLNYALVDELSQKIQDALTPDFGEIRIDARSNSLIVSDTAAKMNKIDHMVKSFDRKDKEVLVEAKIIQITLSDDFKLGIDWETIVSKFHGLNITNDFDILSTSDKSGRLSIGTLSDDEYTATMEALQTIGKTKILSSPSIAAKNNQEAKILVGSTEPYVTTTTTTPASGPTTVAESINFIDVGVKLYVTPTIHNDGFITMDIKPEVSTVTSNLRTSNNNTIPIVETTEAETVVTVKNGVTIVIGGLIKNDNISEVKQIPLLGKIPLFGRAFRSESKEETVNEIAIFLTPTIITGDTAESAYLSDSTFFPENFDW